MPEPTKTRTDLIERAATELGALTSMQSLSDEDRATLDNLVDPLVLQLSLDGIATVADTEEIPSEWLIPLGALLANMAAPSFGQLFSKDLKDEQERILRRLTAERPTYEPIRSEFF